MAIFPAIWITTPANILSFYSLVAVSPQIWRIVQNLPSSGITTKSILTAVVPQSVSKKVLLVLA